MISKLEEMMSRYPTETLLDKENALKETCQDILLYGLSKTNFFASAAMYGGTAMRLFLGLDRFSEDLDFTLKENKPDFSWNPYLPTLRKVLASFGLGGDITVKEKDTGVSTALLSEPTKDTLLFIYPEETSASHIVFNQRTKIKFEIALQPSLQATYQQGYLEYPTSFGITLLDPPSLFSGKISALLYRDWKGRTKGRDYYDFAFYVRKGIHPNMAYLKEQIQRKENISCDITNSQILSRLKKRFSAIDFEQAKKDVLPFLSDASRLEVWSRDYFDQLAEKVFPE
jgi:hypothetical protein